MDTWHIPGEIAGNPRIKEKLLKIIQYYNQFLKGYYEAHVNDPKGLEKALQVQGLLSSCRKSIRFLKWITHLTAAADKIKEINDIKASGGVVKAYKYWDIVNEFCNASYFFGDNRALFVNAGILKPNQFINNALYSGDFFADISGIISSILQLSEIPSEQRVLRLRKEELESRSKNSSLVNINNATPEMKIIKSKLKDLQSQRKAATFQLIINGLQLISSANYKPISLWKRLFGADCPDTVVGLSGVISSSVVIYEQWPQSEINEDEEVEAEELVDSTPVRIAKSIPNGTSPNGHAPVVITEGTLSNSPAN